MLTFEEKESIFFDAVINFEGQYESDFLMKFYLKNYNPHLFINDARLGSTKLHVAVISKYCTPALVQSILSEDPSMLNKKNVFHVTPLHRAVYYAKNLDVVIELLKHGAHVNSVEVSMMSSLHIAAYNNNQFQYDLLEILINCGGNINCLDYKDQTPLHMLVKNNVVQEQSLYLMLQNDADPNAIDANNNSILKVALLNKHISVNVITTLLSFGANPDGHLIYCFKNLAFAKLLIQYLAVKNVEIVFQNIDDGSFALLPNRFIDLSFCSDTEIYVKLTTFRDNCIKELMAMRTINCNQTCTLFQFVSELSSNARLRNVDKNISLLEDGLLCLNCDAFSHCSDLIAASFELQDLLNILFEQGVYTLRSESDRVYLNYYAITEIASYITKVDLINLTIAYMSEHKDKILTKRKMPSSKSIKRIGEALNDSMLSMKRLKL